MKMKKTIIVALLLAVGLTTVQAQTGSGIKNYVVTIEGMWAGPAGDPRAGKSVYGTYNISARSETDALQEARSRFRAQYPDYRNIGERVTNTTPSNTRPAQEAMSPPSRSAPSAAPAPSAPSAPALPALSDEQTLLAYAINYANMGWWDALINVSTELIRLDPNNVNNYGLRSSAYNEKGDYDRAIADANHALRLDPKKAKAYDERGFAYYSKGDYDRAIADYTQAIQIDPKIAYIYLGRSAAYFQKKDYPRAFEDFEAALKIDPNSAKNNRKIYPSEAILYNREGSKVINGVKLEVFDGVLRMQDTNSDDVIRSVEYIVHFADGSIRGPETLTFRISNGQKTTGGASSNKSPVTSAIIIEVRQP